MFSLTYINKNKGNKEPVQLNNLSLGAYEKPRNKTILE